LTAIFLESPRPGENGTLWLAIKNNAKAPRVFCRPSWGYSWFSDSGPISAEENAKLHGCGGTETDPYWLLMPGEHRFDSFNVKTPLTSDYELEVRVEINEKPVGRFQTAESQTLSWKGRLADAVALGEKLKSGRFE